MDEIIKINKNIYLKKMIYNDQNEYGIKIIKYENVTPWYKLFKTNYHINSYFSIHLYKDSIHIIYYPNNYVGHVNINIKDILTILFLIKITFLYHLLNSYINYLYSLIIILFH